MEYDVNKRKYYPIIGTGAALLANVSLFFDPLIWLVCAVGANIFLTVGTLLEAAVFSEWDERGNPKRLRLPLRSLILAFLAAIVTGILAGNAAAALLAAFSWGLITFPLIPVILRRQSFSEALRTSLLWGSIEGLITFSIQVLLTSPGLSFRPAYCVRLLHERMSGLLTQSLTEAAGDGFGAVLQKMLGSTDVKEVSRQVTLTLISVAPAFYAIALLAAAGLFWWIVKNILKSTSFPVSFMGRFDSYTPSGAIVTVYFITFLFNLFSAPDSAVSIAATNITYVLSFLLAYGGISLAAYFLNRKISSKALRVIALIALIWIALMTQIGIWAFVLLGMLSGGRNLRGGIGGNLR